MGFITRVRDRAARVALRIAKRKGEQFDFINPGVAAVPLYGFLKESSQEAGLRGGPTDRFKITFIAPRQTSFPPADIKPGATIRYPMTTGTEYQIDVITPDNETLALSATIEMECGRFGTTVEIG